MRRSNWEKDLGYLSVKMKMESAGLFSKSLPHLNVIIIFKNDRSIGSFFGIKERLEPLLCSGIVHKYNCLSCNACYIGSTMRWLFVGISEHRGVSSRTGQIGATQPFSAICDHCLEKDHMMRKDNFCIIDRSFSQFDLLIKESIHIHTEKPTLNNQISALKLYITWSIKSSSFISFRFSVVFFF